MCRQSSLFSNTLWFLNSKYLPILKPLYEPATNLFIVGPQILVTHVYYTVLQQCWLKLYDLDPLPKKTNFRILKPHYEIKV